MRYRYRNSAPLPNRFGMILAFLAIVAVLFSYPMALMGSRTTVTATVNRTESVNSGKGHKYLVFTDVGVFENTDSLWFGKWDSSDVYNSLAVGGTYRFEVVGWRMPFFSMYQNIIAAEKVTR